VTPRRDATALQLLAIYLTVVAGVAAAAGRTTVWVAPVIAAVVGALLLLPLRDLAQRTVSRVVYGRWREPYAVLAGLGERLAGAADLDRLLHDAIVELGAALDLGDIRITAVQRKSEGDGSNALQLVAYGRPVGWLEYTTHRPLGTTELRLLGDLAHELGASRIQGCPEVRRHEAVLRGIIFDVAGSPSSSGGPPPKRTARDGLPIHARCAPTRCSKSEGRHH